jgi:hypothetical protein
MRTLAILMVGVTAACGGNDEARPDARGGGAIDATGSIDAVASVDAAGGALQLRVEPGGAVRVRSGATTLAVCRQDCVVDAAPGTTLDLYAGSAAVFTGWTDGCSGSSRACQVTTGVAPVVVGATFALPASALWVRELVDVAAVLSVELLADDRLVVGTSAGARLLAADGGQVWASPAVPGAARVSATGAIYVLHGRDLVRLEPGTGAELWRQEVAPAGTEVGGPTASTMAHRFETGPSDEVVMVVASNVVKVDSTGAVAWTRAITGNPRGPVAVDGAGTVLVAIEDPVSVEGTLVARWSAAGVALADTAAIGPQYQAAMAVDGSGQLLGSTSGHGHVDLVRRGQGAGAGAYAVRVDLDDPDYVDSGVAATSAGDAAWMYTTDELLDPVVGLRLSRVSPTGAVSPRLDLRSEEDPVTFDRLGVVARDVAVALDGERYAVAGRAYSVDSGTGHGWILVGTF